MVRVVLVDARGGVTALSVARKSKLSVRFDCTKLLLIFTRRSEVALPFVAFHFVPSPCAKSGVVQTSWVELRRLHEGAAV